MARKRLRPRTIVITVIVLLLLAGLFAGFEWVYERGLKREGLFDRARRAFVEKHYDTALSLARETLVSEPGRDAARELIVECLISESKLDEAKSEARRYLDENPERSFAATQLCRIAMQQGDGDTAERLALTFADRNPGYAYHVLAVIRDYRGLMQRDPRQRLDAAALMRSFASVAEKDADKADAILFAAEIFHEVGPLLPEAALIDQRAQADLKEAATDANAALQADKSYPYEVSMGRIRVLSDDPEEAALGAKMLRAHTTGALKQDIAVEALARYHVERGEWSEAADLARNLSDAYLWQRLCWIVRANKQPDAAAAVLEGGPFAGTPDAEIARAELMLRSTDAARKDAASKALASIIENHETASSEVARALVILATGAGADVALASAERAGLEARNDPRLTALLASLLSCEGKEKGVDLAERLARECNEPSSGRDILPLLGSGQDAFDRFVDTQVSKGGAEEAHYRLQRAITLLARAKAAKGDAEGAKALVGRVESDLNALRTDEHATKAELVAGFQLAASIGQPELGGELVARALLLPGDPILLDARLLAFARGAQNTNALAAVANGMRKAGASLPASAYLGILADTVAAPEKAEGKTILPRLEEAAKETGSHRYALELASVIAFNEGDATEAERLGRLVLETDPKSEIALEAVGASLLRRGTTNDVLALYGAIPADQWPECAYRQTARAHLLQGDKDMAIAVAREAVRRFPQSAGASFLLAQIYRDVGDLRKALSVLSIAPPQSFVLHLRAEILRQLGDLPMAERIYQVLLAGTNFSDVVAWQGLMETLAAQKRMQDFVLLCGRAFDSKRLDGNPKAAASLHYMRGTCLEADGKAEEALVDYEAAVRLDGTHWGALNNAAWYIARSMPTRIADARAYADRAVSLNPDAAAVLDTAAEVHSVQGDMPGALALMDRALQHAPTAKVAAYTVHKAEILRRGEREEDAKALIEEVRTKYADDAPAQQRARSLLWEIERKHLPEEEPAKLPAVPEEEEQRPGTGGGE